MIIHDYGITKTVNINNNQYSTSQFLYLMTKSLEYISNGINSAEITLITSNSPKESINLADSGQLYKAEYLQIAKNVNKFIENKSVAPNFASSSLGDVGYDNLVDIFTRILSYYKINNRLPDYVELNTENSSSSNWVSIGNIVGGAYELINSFGSYNSFTATVDVGGLKTTLPEFLYLMSKAIYQINNNDKNPIKYIAGVGEATSLDDVGNLDSTLSLSKYVEVANNVAAFIVKNNRVPNYASSNIGDIHYLELIHSFSRILSFYKEDNRLPDSVRIYYPYNL